MQSFALHQGASDGLEGFASDTPCGAVEDAHAVGEFAAAQVFCCEDFFNAFA